jgi:V8-like Glu-specific endopeptidase
MDLAHHPMPMAKKLPLKDKDQRIYVIGHPRGGKISFSLYDNLLLDHDIPKIHYRSPTQGGSSGSPVFNQNWDLIGLHHAGGTRVQKLNGKVGVYPANEGIWIQSIASMIAAKRAN